jgi:hypothetical protein
VVGAVEAAGVTGAVFAGEVRGVGVGWKQLEVGGGVGEERREVVGGWVEVVVKVRGVGMGRAGVLRREGVLLRECQGSRLNGEQKPSVPVFFAYVQCAASTTEGPCYDTTKAVYCAT